MAVGAACAALLGLGVATAHAELALSTRFGSSGTGDGQFNDPYGIGVDQTALTPTSGDVYVADRFNARIEQFDSSGNFIRMWGWGVADGASSFEVCTSGCQSGLYGSGAGQFSNPLSIAVDSSSGPSQGDVYVDDYSNDVIDKFSPSGSLLATITGPSPGTSFSAIVGVAVDANGDLWIAQEAGNVYELDSSGGLLAEFNDAYASTRAIAVDATGVVYLMNGNGETDKWSAAARADGSPTRIDFLGGTGLAVDPSTNDLYVDLGPNIDEWEANGESLGNFGSGWLVYGVQMAYNPNVIMPGAAGPGALYVADGSANRVAVFVPPAPKAPVVESGSENATGVTAKAATLEARVGPEGLDTHVYFEYGLTAAYGSSSPAPPGTDIGSSFGASTVTTSLSGLTAGTTYHYRVVAANSLGTTDGPDMTFTAATPTPPTVSGEAATKITSLKATLAALVNPHFANTHYFFEYGPTTAYGTQVPIPPGNEIGETGEPEVAVEISNLQPQTTYHFRVVATNLAGTADGEDETFTTEPPIAIDSVFATNVTTTSVELGAKINPKGTSAQYHFEYGTTPSYGNDAPVPDGAINATETVQGVAVHIEGLQPGTKYYFRVVASDSYTTLALNGQPFTTYTNGEPTGLADGRVYELVSPTAKNGADVGGTTLSGFLRGNESAWGHATPTGSAIAYSSFTSFGDAQSAEVLTQYISSRGPTGWTTHSISPPVTSQTGASIRHGYHFLTPDLTKGIVSWFGAPLAPGAAEGNFEDLYIGRTSSNEYEPVTTVAPPNRVSGYEVSFEGASADLHRVVFNGDDALLPGARANESNVYEWVKGSLRLVSVLPGPGNVAAENAGAGSGENEETVQENVISADGSRIFWTGDQGQLYVREGGTTTVKLNASERVPSLGDGSARFRGATLDGSRAFFTDTTPLTDAPDDNGGLYEYDLSSRKLRDLSPDGSAAPEVEGVSAVSEDGLSVYFVARASLTGGASAGGYNLYLSRDGALRFIAALSSEDQLDWSTAPEDRTARVTPDGEHLVYVSQASLSSYDNADVNTGSHDAEVFLYDAGSDRLRCISCNPNGARPVGPASVPIGERTGHPPRFISDDGRRVFFNSKDVLVPSDTNGQQNVYEYENGTIHMISSGTSEDPSAFSDSSTNGDDAFFTTRAQLVPEDTDGNFDMYDARVGGGFPAPSSSPPCTGENCRGPLSAPPAPLGIDTEAGGSAPEGVPSQHPTVQPKAAPGKKKKARRKGHKTIRRKAAQKSKTGPAGRHRAKRPHRKKHRRGGKL